MEEITSQSESDKNNVLMSQTSDIEFLITCPEYCSDIELIESKWTD